MSGSDEAFHFPDSPSTRVLVTGGTGVLGTRVVQHLQSRAVTVRILSRRPPPRQMTSEWAVADLATGHGLNAALEDVDVIVHAATSPLRPDEDLAGARHLLRHARTAGVRHVLYVSIVGVDQPGPFRYYTVKRQIEQEIARSGVPYTIVRSTQFHEFVSSLLRRLSLGPVVILPNGVTLQPVAADCVAAHLADAALRAPGGRRPDLRGPDTQSLAGLARAWLRATGPRRWTLRVPLPIPLFRAMQGGRVTSDRAQPVGPTWTTWLAQTTSPSEPDRTSR